MRIGAGRPVRLTKLELRLLQMLLANAGTPSAPTGCWCRSGDIATPATGSLLKQLVHRLRQKIEADPASPTLLQTASGAGYKLVVD